MWYRKKRPFLSRAVRPDAGLSGDDPREPCPGCLLERTERGMSHREWCKVRTVHPFPFSVTDGGLKVFEGTGKGLRDSTGTLGAY